MRPTNKTLRKLGLMFAAEEAGIVQYVLKRNSLKILLVPDANARSATVVQHVHVGSRHEGSGNTGYAHLLEHMLFKGTPTRNRLKGNSYDEFVKSQGNNMNATTSNDRTNYFATVAMYALGELLEYEADRLRQATLAEEDLISEMPVVVKEFELGENDPQSVMQRMIPAIAFTEHQYKVDTIGSKSEVLRATAASLKDKLYNVYYWPNNTTLIVAGGEESAVLELIVKAYGKLEPSPHAIPVPFTIEPPQLGERRFVINKPGDLPLVCLAYHVPEADHADHYALTALVTMLGRNKTSRLYRSLVEKGFAMDAQAYMQESHDPGLFQIGVTVNPEVDPKKIERIVLREIEKFKTKPIKKSELASLKRLNRNGTLMTRASQQGLAHQISENEAVADWQWGTRYDEQFDKVTVEHIMAVATKYLTADNRTVGYFLPSGEPLAQDDSAQPMTAIADDDLALRDVKKTVEVAKPANMKPVSLAKSATTVELPNGLKLVLMPTPKESAVGFALSVNVSPQEGKLNSMLPSLATRMMTSGSARFTKTRINKAIAEMGASFNIGADHNSAMMNTLVPPESLPLFLEMVSDAFVAPKFDAKEMEIVRTRMNSSIMRNDDNPDNRAWAGLTQMLYDSGSKLYQVDRAQQEADLAALTAKDLETFKSQLGPKGAVLSLVGKFEVEAMKKLVESKFAKWQGGSAPDFTTDTSNVDAKGKRKNIRMEGKDAISIVVGQRSALSSKSPDYIAAMIANKALGGDTMTARLGYQIRERRGLTYGVYSSFAGTTFGDAPWAVSMATDRPNLDRAVGLISNIIKQYVRDGIGDIELAEEKKSMAASHAISFDTNAEIASSLSHLTYTGLGIEYLDSYESKLMAVTKDEVNAAIRKYFAAENCTIVVAGTLPEGSSN